MKVWFLAIRILQRGGHYIGHMGVIDCIATGYCGLLV